MATMWLESPDGSMMLTDPSCPTGSVSALFAVRMRTLDAIRAAKTRALRIIVTAQPESTAIVPCARPSESEFLILSAFSAAAQRR
jgi:hypothetical protein